jgi:putative SOS response-associated peptidase YedK
MKLTLAEGGNGMCGRFTITVTLEELLDRFTISEVTGEYMPRYNVAPGQSIPVIVEKSGVPHMGFLHWGLIPSWAKDKKIGYSMINAKAETLTEKPSFRTAFERRRCLIPADGFYEWKVTASGKRPMRITLKDRGIFAMAGLFDTWTAPDGTRLGSCTIVTTTPNKLVADIHDRMPVIVPREFERTWLDRGIRDTAGLQRLLLPYPEDQMAAYPVDPKVGSVKNDSPDCADIFDWNSTLSD